MEQNIFAWRCGSAEVYTLVERQGPGNAGVLLDADPAAVKKYTPASGLVSAVNAFLVKDKSGITLFDTAFGGQIVESMKSLGVSPGDVTAVVITHLHGDHYTGLEKDGTAFFPNATLYLSAREYEWGMNAKGGGMGKSAAAVLAPWKERIKTVEPGSPEKPETILPGTGAIAAYGHTPGHTVYLVESGGEKLLITGDMVHVGEIQFPLPELSVSFDSDPALARASRLELLAWAAKTGTPVAGMHLAYPALGTVSAEGSGFRFVPEQEKR